MQEDITIQDLYPDLTPEQQEEAEENLVRYLELIKRIYDRHESEGTLEGWLADIRKPKDQGTK